MSFQKGDLIQLESEDGEDIMNTGWCYGECERTKKKGDFPAECVYVLPAITKPPMEVLVNILNYSKYSVWLHSICRGCLLNKMQKQLKKLLQLRRVH